MQLINKTYFDKIRWVISHLEQLDLSKEEVIVTLTILNMREQAKQPLTVESISAQANLSNAEVDNAVTLLTHKGYLEIIVIDKQVVFSVDRIFELKPQANDEVLELFKLFEEEFKRLLTQRELEMLNQWITKYTRKEIINALRNASIMNKLDFNYVNGILRNEK